MKKKTKKAICVYHCVDFDGVISAAVVNKALQEDENINWDIEFIGWTYGMPDIQFPKYDQLFMVDISLNPDIMSNLPKNTIWIDHHVTAIENSVKYGYNNIEGVRLIGKGAVELTWDFFYGGNVPKMIGLLSCYDVWNKESKKYDWDEEILPFQWGLRLLYSLKLDSIFPKFNQLLDESSDKFREVFDSGINVLKYQRGKWKSEIKNHSFPVTVAEKYKGVAIISGSGSGLMFETVLNEYDIYVVANVRTKEDGSQIYTASIYSEPNRVDLSLGNYVQSFGLGGGGHACACGTELTEQQFLNLLLNHKI